MKSRTLVEKTLNFDSPARIPRQAWILPWAEEEYPDEFKKLQNDYPDDIVPAPAVYKKPLGLVGEKYRLGEYIDEWGCKFNNIHKGVIGIICEPRIADWKDLENFKTPDALLSLDKEEVNAFCKSTDKFVLSGNIPRPFERFQFIRTMEQSLMDLLMEPPELQILLNKIHNHYCKEIEVWAQTDIDGISFMDDWGTQQSLQVDPAIFRKYFKPMYKEYADIARSYGKYIFMHSDGFITDIIPDLIEVGINALNSQVFLMGVEELGEKFSGKITFWGEIDRQNLLPKGSKQDIQNAVYEVYNNLYADGGVIAQCEFGPGAKPENVFAVFETWETINRDKNKRVEH